MSAHHKNPVGAPTLYPRSCLSKRVSRLDAGLQRFNGATTLSELQTLLFSSKPRKSRIILVVFVRCKMAYVVFNIFLWGDFGKKSFPGWFQWSFSPIIWILHCFPGWCLWFICFPGNFNNPLFSGVLSMNDVFPGWFQRPIDPSVQYPSGWKRRSLGALKSWTPSLRKLRRLGMEVLLKGSQRSPLLSLFSGMNVLLVGFPFLNVPHSNPIIELL